MFEPFTAYFHLIFLKAIVFYLGFLYYVLCVCVMYYVCMISVLQY